MPALLVWRNNCGSSESTESLKSQSTNCSSQPLLCPSSSLQMEDEHLSPWLRSCPFPSCHQNGFTLYKDHPVPRFLLTPPTQASASAIRALKGSPPGQERTVFIPSISLTLEKKFDSCKDALGTLLYDWHLKKKKEKKILFPQLWKHFINCQMVLSCVSWPELWSSNVDSRDISLPVMVVLLSTLTLN